MIIAQGKAAAADALGNSPPHSPFLCLPRRQARQTTKRSRSIWARNPGRRSLHAGPSPSALRSLPFALAANPRGVACL
jgi:hypothetical protein